MPSYAVDHYDRAALRERLVNLFLESADDASWLALVDTAFDHDARPLPWNKGRWPVYCTGRLARFQTVSPVLLALDTTNAEYLSKDVSRLLHHCQGRPMLSFVQIRHTPEATSPRFE